MSSLENMPVLITLLQKILKSNDRKNEHFKQKCHHEEHSDVVAQNFNNSFKGKIKFGLPRLALFVLIIT